MASILCHQTRISWQWKQIIMNLPPPNSANCDKVLAAVLNETQQVNYIPTQLVSRLHQPHQFPLIQGFFPQLIAPFHHMTFNTWYFLSYAHSSGVGPVCCYVQNADLCFAYSTDFCSPLPERSSVNSRWKWLPQPSKATRGVSLVCWEVFGVCSAIKPCLYCR